MPTNIREQKLMIKITKLAVMLFQANRAQYFLQLANVTTFELVLKMLVKLGDIEFWHGGMSFLSFFLLGIGMVGAAPEHRRTFYETVFPILVRVIDRIGPQSSYYESFFFSKIILYLGHLFAQEPIEPQVIIMEIVSSSFAKKLCDLLNVCTPEWYTGDMDRIKQVLALLLTLFIDQTASDEPALFYYLLVNAKPFPDFKLHLTERPYRQFCEATFKSYSWNCRW